MSTHNSDQLFGALEDEEEESIEAQLAKFRARYDVPLDKRPLSPHVFAPFYRAREAVRDMLPDWLPFLARAIRDYDTIESLPTPSVFLAGGAVHDILHGVPPKDFDIVVLQGTKFGDPLRRAILRRPQHYASVVGSVMSEFFGEVKIETSEPSIYDKTRNKRTNGLKFEDAQGRCPKVDILVFGTPKEYLQAMSCLSDLAIWPILQGQVQFTSQGWPMIHEAIFTAPGFPIPGNSPVRASVEKRQFRLEKAKIRAAEYPKVYGDRHTKAFTFVNSADFALLPYEIYDRVDGWYTMST